MAVARTADHITGDPPAIRPYEKLKDFLTDAHTLTNYEKVMKIVAMGPLGGRKPTELLSALLELCPRGEQETEWFRAMFLSRLPEAIRLHLTHDEEELRVLAKKADGFIAHKSGQQAATINAVEEAEDNAGTVAAVQATNRGGGRGRGRYRFNRGGQQRQPQQHQHQQQPSQSAQDGQQQRDDPSPQQLAIQASGLCRTHFKYGKGAFTCFPPCTWQGN